MEKSEQRANTHTSQNSRFMKHVKRMWAIWNRVLERKSPQGQNRPSTPNTGNLAIQYPDRGTRRIHMTYMEAQITLEQSAKLKGVKIVEYLYADSEQDHAVKLQIKGLPIQSVHNLEDGFRVTTTKPEDAETLRRIIGCGVVLDCVLECTSPAEVLPKKELPVVEVLPKEEPPVVEELPKEELPVVEVLIKKYWSMSQVAPRWKSPAPAYTGAGLIVYILVRLQF